MKEAESNNKDVQSILEPISEYLFSITRNDNDYYEILIGIPNSWAFKENNEISIKVEDENNIGKVLKIFPKNKNITIDDLILFVEIIINTNKKISEKEMEFTKKLEETKIDLENQAKEFYRELEELKENSFKKFGDASLLIKRGRTKKNKNDSTTKIVEEQTINDSNDDINS